MRKLWLIVCVGLLAFSSCKKDNEESCEGNSNAISISHDGMSREYVLHVPTNYDGSSPLPIVFNFHGYGGTASSHMLDGDMRAQANADTFLLVYPQGSCLEGTSHWNPCPSGGDNKSSVDDAGFVEAIINSLATQYNVDQERIYACGYSNGGMMAYGLAHYKSEKIAAVASISGSMLDCTAPASHPMPVLHLHGTSDNVLPYNGGSDYTSVQSTLNYWINANNCNTGATTNSDNSGGMTIEHYAYEQGDSSVSVEHYKYEGGGHVWFSNTYQGKNASALVWDFFSKYDINGLR